MNDDVLANSAEPVRGNPFQKGRSGNPAGRRPGARIEAAYAGDPMALRLCVERLLPVCRERAVKFKLPPIESPADIAAAMKAVTAALAAGVITPGEAGRIAAMVDTFIRAIDTSDFDRRLQQLEEKLKRDDAAQTRSASSTWPYNR